MPCKSESNILLYFNYNLFYSEYIVEDMNINQVNYKLTTKKQAMIVKVPLWRKEVGITSRSFVSRVTRMIIYCRLIVVVVGMVTAIYIRVGYDSL